MGLHMVYFFESFCRICPSVILYLLSVCPAIWLIELNKLDTRLEEKEAALRLSLGYVDDTTTFASTPLTSSTTTMIKLLDQRGDQRGEIEGQSSINVMNTTGMKNDSNLPSLDVLGNVGVQVTI